jgi:hypothetical protein
MKTSNTNVRKSASGKGRATVTQWHRYLLAAGIVSLVLAWLLWPTSQIAKVRQMQQELFSAPRDEMSPEERKQRFEELRAERDKLTDAERDELRKDRSRQMQQKLNAEGAKYFSMSPAERRQVIDERIAREDKRAESGGKGFAGVPGGQVALGGFGKAGAAKGPATPEERDTRRREMLLNLTPTARAGMDQMRLDKAKLRAER